MAFWAALAPLAGGVASLFGGGKGQSGGSGVSLNGFSGQSPEGFMPADPNTTPQQEPVLPMRRRRKPNLEMMGEYQNG